MISESSPNLSHTAPVGPWYRNVVRGKTRIAMAWLFALALGFSAREYPQWPGILLCLAGATLRYWASGYLRKDTRPAVGGPYAWVRNPLYLGTYMMALGTALAIENWWLLAVITIAFAVIYHFIILDEEVKLREIFGEPYVKYCASVPRFFPNPVGWMSPGYRRRLQSALLEVNPEAEHRVYSNPIAAKNKAYEAYASFAGLIGFVTLVAFVWKRVG